MAAPVMSSTGKPAGMVPPSKVRASTEKRPWYCDGARHRSTSSTAFGSSDLYVEEYFSGARHIEVQIAASGDAALGIESARQAWAAWLVGVTVGAVDKVDLDPAGTLVITYRIQNVHRVPLGSVATIVPNGFFGDMGEETRLTAIQGSPSELSLDRTLHPGNRPPPQGQ